MQIKNMGLLAVCCIIILGLAGCAGYHAKPLKSLSRGVMPSKKENLVSFDYHIFSKKDCRKYLDRNVIKQGYQPILVSITNNTDNRLDLSMARCSLPCANPEQVAQLVHTSTKGRVLGYGIPGLFIWPFLIPAVVDGINSSEANNLLDKDFERKTLEESQILQPYSTIEGLIFVAIEDFTPDFSITLLDQSNGNQFVLNSKNQRYTIQA